MAARAGANLPIAQADRQGIRAGPDPTVERPHVEVEHGRHDGGRRPGPDVPRVQHDAEELIVEVQPAERGLQSQILKADLVLWTVGNKPSLPQLEPCDKPHMLPLNNRGQAETDETLRVKGNPRIFALGDSSALRDPNGRLLPSTAQVVP